MLASSFYSLLLLAVAGSLFFGTVLSAGLSSYLESFPNQYSSIINVTLTYCQYFRNINHQVYVTDGRMYLIINEALAGPRPEIIHMFTSDPDSGALFVLSGSTLAVILDTKFKEPERAERKYIPQEDGGTLVVDAQMYTHYEAIRAALMESLKTAIQITTDMNIEKAAFNVVFAGSNMGAAFAQYLANEAVKQGLVGKDATHLIQFNHVRGFGNQSKASLLVTKNVLRISACGRRSGDTSFIPYGPLYYVSKNACSYRVYNSDIFDDVSKTAESKCQDSCKSNVSPLTAQFLSDLDTMK